jgi:hypothetical protein
LVKAYMTFCFPSLIQKSAFQLKRIRDPR